MGVAFTSNDPLNFPPEAAECQREGEEENPTFSYCRGKIQIGSNKCHLSCPGFVKEGLWSSYHLPAIDGKITVCPHLANSVHTALVVILTESINLRLP